MSRSFFSENTVFIIAEAGVNHNGDIALAHQLIDAAVQAGADAVKFQTFRAEKIATASAPKAKYQQERAEGEESQFSMLKKLELPEYAYGELIQHCADEGIQFLSTPFDVESISFLKKTGVPLLKLPSGEITNLPYLRHAAGQGLPIILSTGMSTLDEVAAAVRVLEDGASAPLDLCLLHCTTQYPTPMEDVNLRAMQTLQDHFAPYCAGYSDHTLGIEVPTAAVAMGARVVEKHFTLDKTMAGPDHAASLEPDELRQMVRAIRNIEVALGTAAKGPSATEQDNRLCVRKSIVAAVPIAAGTVFTEENLTTKRPGTGLNPMFWDAVIGKKAPRDFERDELLDESLGESADELQYELEHGTPSGCHA